MGRLVVLGKLEESSWLELYHDDFSPSCERSNATVFYLGHAHSRGTHRNTEKVDIAKTTEELDNEYSCTKEPCSEEERYLQDMEEGRKTDEDLIWSEECVSVEKGLD